MKRKTFKDGWIYVVRGRLAICELHNGYGRFYDYKGQLIADDTPPSTMGRLVSKASAEKQAKFLRQREEHRATTLPLPDSPVHSQHTD
jgi:hypothetical protein